MTYADADADAVYVPAPFSTPPLIRDVLVTASSSAQDETVQECLPLITNAAESARNPFDVNEHGVPRLDRQQHVEFLEDALGEFPAQFVGADASRPWMVYWGLTGLRLLGEDVSTYRARFVCLVSLCLHVCTTTSANFEKRPSL